MKEEINRDTAGKMVERIEIHRTDRRDRKMRNFLFERVVTWDNI